MARYRDKVLASKFLDADTGVYRYPHPVSEKDILTLAGVKSRSTLKASYHDALREELRACVAELKLKTGKGGTSRKPVADEAHDQASSGVGSRTRIEQMAETIGALSYKIIALEKELAGFRAGNPAIQKVTSLTRQTALRKRRSIP